ncbi:exocyst complex component 7 [Vigna unguiculata]|uniref:Exocyst subunit Exo70 family protein n=2 Tax=Vigna unguiculata TaxID=3917 RepID=A0A4D6N247_VIGUN|nr:exocyst complex component 7 [Vigna unguiculata]
MEKSNHHIHLRNTIASFSWHATLYISLHLPLQAHTYSHCKLPLIKKTNTLQEKKWHNYTQKTPSCAAKMRTICWEPKTQSFAFSRHTSAPSSSLSTTPSTSTKENMVSTSIEEAEALILKWDPETSAYGRVTSLFYNDKAEAMHYIHCVNQLQKTMHALLAENPSSRKLVLAQKLMQMAMKRLQKEFYQMLSMSRAHLDPESVSARSSTTSRSSFCSDSFDEGTAEDDVRDTGDCISEVERVSSETVAVLKSIADCMVSNGYGKECVNVYTTMRKSIVDEGVYRLSVEELSASKVNKMDWEVLELKIKGWLEAVKIAVRTLFAGERTLCDQVFGASQSIAEACFAEISRSGAAVLFGFPDLVVRTKKSPPEKIFRIIDMYAAMASLWPEIESVFSYDSTTASRSQAYALLLRLSESVQTSFFEIETAIQKDSSKPVSKFAGVHPLTVQVMNHLSTLADYSNVLSEIFLDVPQPSRSPLPESYLYSPRSDNSTTTGTEFSVQMARLILVLLCKIDGKSRHCKEVSLSYLFLTNNLRHVVAKVRTSNLLYVVGDDWVLNHEAKVKQLMTSYERVAWGKVLSSLPENPAAEMSPAEARVMFGNFNLEFEKAYRKENAFTILEQEFREETKASLARKISPIYREMYETLRNSVGSAREMREYVIFTPEDVENYMLNLFSAGRSSSITEENSSFFVRKKFCKKCK